MRCEQVREQLAEHLLGTLDPTVDAAVAAHLRGCGACRGEMATLAEGVSTFAAAAHDVDPPAELRGRVIAVLHEEWEQTSPAPPPRSRPASFRRVAGIAALVAALGWAVVATVQADRLEYGADKYEALLGALGGEDVRVARLRAEGSQDLQGSVLIYDSKVGQSWVLVLARAPGREGTANVTMVADGGRTIDLHELEFGSGGEASTWLVTASDLADYDQVNVWNEGGVIATAHLERG